MDIRAGISPVCLSSRCLSYPTHPASTSVGSSDGRISKVCGKIGWSLALRDLEHGRFVGPAPYSIHVRASSGNSKRNKRGEKSKGVQRTEDPKKKENVWSSASSSDQPRGVPEKMKQEKKHKPNVWSSDASGTLLQQIHSRNKESEVGGSNSASPRAMNGALENESDQRVEPLEQPSNAKSASSAKDKRKQPRKDVQDVEFLKYLSPVLPVKEETLLQAEEQVPNPVWSTFCSSASGVWRGVMAAFSPITAEFEPLSLHENRQFIHDARVLSTVETLRTSEDGAIVPPDKHTLSRRVLWSLKNPLGKDGEGTVMVQDDDDDGDVDSGDDARSGSYDEVDETGYWEDNESSDGDEEQSGSEWEYVLSAPRDIDERWEDEGVGDIDLMKELEVDTVSMGDEATEWTSKRDQGEGLDKDWEGGGLVSAEVESDLMAEWEASIAHSPILSTPVGQSSVADLTDSLGKTWTDVIEEDCMEWEPGLVFFEDGAYSRGPLELLTGASSSGSEDFNVYTCKIEQCLVAGGHKRLRIVHTISVEEYTEKVELLRLAVYEEEWMGPCNMKSISDSGGHQLKLLSERARHEPKDIVGNWKVFEVDAMVIDKRSFVYSCKETSILRGLPEIPNLHLEGASIDINDFCMSWLTGSVSTYASLSEGAMLTFGVGWICDDGTRLVIERAYGGDGNLAYVKLKSEIKVGRVGR